MIWRIETINLWTMQSPLMTRCTDFLHCGRSFTTLLLQYWASPKLAYQHLVRIVSHCVWIYSAFCFYDILVGWRYKWLVNCCYKFPPDSSYFSYILEVIHIPQYPFLRLLCLLSYFIFSFSLLVFSCFPLPLSSFFRMASIWFEDEGAVRDNACGGDWS